MADIQVRNRDNVDLWHPLPRDDVRREPLRRWLPLPRPASPPPCAAAPALLFRSCFCLALYRPCCSCSAACAHGCLTGQSRCQAWDASSMACRRACSSQRRTSRYSSTAGGPARRGRGPSPRAVTRTMPSRSSPVHILRPRALSVRVRSAEACRLSGGCCCGCGRNASSTINPKPYGRGTVQEPKRA